MGKIKILFLIHDLMHGGAEKVLLNLVNNMDHENLILRFRHYLM